MRWSILTQPDAIVREHEDGAKMTHGCQAHRRTHVVREGQERGAEWDEPAVVDHAIEAGAHRVLSDAKMDIAPRVAPNSAHRPLAIALGDAGSLKVPRPFQCSIRGRIQVRRAADELWNALGNGVQYVPGRHASGHGTILWLEGG